MLKMMSGRWLFTVIASLVFAYLSCAGKIEPKDSMQLITMIAIFYFNRNDREQKGDKNVQKAN